MRCPSITEIRKHLGYGNSKKANCQAFYDDVRDLRRHFVLQSGKKGVDLYEWKEYMHQPAWKRWPRPISTPMATGIISGLKTKPWTRTRASSRRR